MGLVYAERHPRNYPYILIWKNYNVGGKEVRILCEIRKKEGWPTFNFK